MNRAIVIEDLPTPPEGKIGWPWTDASLPLAAKMPDGSPWPKISIVTPSFNQAQYLEETIRSVLLQNYPNLEYIIIDGGSTDGSVEIIKKYEPWLTYWVSEPDRNQTHAVNKGIRHCSGELFAFINSDDFYYPNTLLGIANLYQEHGRKSDTWIGGRIHIVNETGQVLSTRKNSYGREPIDWYLHRWTKHGTTFSQPASFWSLSIFDQAGVFDESFNYSFDYEFFVRMYSLGIEWIDSEGTFAAFRIHPNSKTISADLSFVEEDYKIAKKYWHLNKNNTYLKLLRKAGVQVHKKKLTQLLLEEKNLWGLLRNVAPILLRHPQFLFLRRTWRGLLNASFTNRPR